MERGALNFLSPCLAKNSVWEFAYVDSCSCVRHPSNLHQALQILLVREALERSLSDKLLSRPSRTGRKRRALSQVIGVCSPYMKCIFSRNGPHCPNNLQLELYASYCCKSQHRIGQLTPHFSLYHFFRKVSRFTFILIVESFQRQVAHKGGAYLRFSNPRPHGCELQWKLQ